MNKSDFKSHMVVENLGEEIIIAGDSAQINSERKMKPPGNSNSNYIDGQRDESSQLDPPS